MANDRLYLACDFCGAEVCIGKYNPSTGFYTNREWTDTADFLNEHGNCFPVLNNLDGKPGFSILNEKMSAERQGKPIHQKITEREQAWRTKTFDDHLERAKRNQARREKEPMSPGTARLVEKE